MRKVVTIKLQTPYYRAFDKQGKMVAEHLTKNASGLRKLVATLRGKVDEIDWKNSNVENPFIKC